MKLTARMPYKLLIPAVKWFGKLGGIDWERDVAAYIRSRCTQVSYEECFGGLLHLEHIQMKSESDSRPDERTEHTLSRWGIGKELVAVSALYAIPAGMFTYLYPNLFIIPIPRWALTIAGGALLLIGIPLLGWAACTFTVGFNQGNLVTNGLFSLVRNPIYAVWMFFLIPAIALLCASWLLLLTPLVTYLGFVRFIRREESYLTKRFGQRYLDYKAHTHALWLGSALAWRRDQRRVK